MKLDRILDSALLSTAMVSETWQSSLPCTAMVSYCLLCTFSPLQRREEVWLNFLSSYQVNLISNERLSRGYRSNEWAIETAIVSDQTLGFSIYNNYLFSWLCNLEFWSSFPRSLYSSSRPFPALVHGEDESRCLGNADSRCTRNARLRPRLLKKRTLSRRYGLSHVWRPQTEVLLGT